MSDLQRQFDLAGYRNKFTRRAPGLMGRKDSATPTFTTTVPGGQGYVYVRLADGSGSSLVIAFNRAGVALTGDLKIWLETDMDNRWIIVGVRY